MTRWWCKTTRRCIPLRLAFVAAVLAWVTACGSDSAGEQQLTLAGSTMGTNYSVTLPQPPTHLNHSRLRTDIEGILTKLNDQMSTYRGDSELSRFNQSETTDWVNASEDLVAVIQTALGVSKLSDGAFDVTVGPLVNLWGFGPGQQDDRIPTSQEVAAALMRTGYQQLHARTSPPSIKKDEGHIYVDLSAIAKGYGVDKLAEHLDSLGVSDYLVDIGGELRAKGHNASGSAWRIAIEKPTPGERSIHEIISITEGAMATSGDYRNYFEKDGKRYSHTINPKTGLPIAHKLASVTVINASTMYADAMATALLVLGPELGYSLAEREALAALFIVKSTNGFSQMSTSAFDQQYMRD